MARPLMRDFAAYAGGTVSIAMPFGLDFIYVETLRTTDAVPHVPDVGFTSTMATTAVGRALLSLYTGEEVESYIARVKAERAEETQYVLERTLPDMELCKERGFAVSLGEWRREIFGVAAPLYRTAGGDCLSVNCGIPSFRFSAEQIERECGPRILGLARSIRSLVASDRQMIT
jgi:DNA-binding IclR family transcriptional regulator